eukprot:7743198-Pyramimonas_sp.AAC.1
MRKVCPSISATPSHCYAYMFSAAPLALLGWRRIAVTWAVPLPHKMRNNMMMRRMRMRKWRDARNPSRTMMLMMRRRMGMK